MREWPPLVFLIVLVLLVAARPWRKVDPKHEYIVNMLANLGGEDSTNQFGPVHGEAHTIGH